MTYTLYAQCEVGCDGERKAMLQPASYRLHKRNDVLDPSLRIQNMAVSSDSPVLQRISQRFWQTLELGYACIFWLPPFLFRFVCIVFCCLGTVLLFSVSLLFRVFVGAYSSIRYSKTCNDLYDRQPYWNVWETRSKVLFDDTICTSSRTWKSPLRSRRSITC